MTIGRTRMTYLAWLCRLCLVVAPLCAALSSPALASAAAPPPDWMLTAQSAPTYFAPGDTADQYTVRVFNNGGPTDGSPITIADQLPPGVTASAIDGFQDEGDGYVFGYRQGSGNVACDLPTLTCTPGAIAPGDYVTMVITVSVPSSASGTLTDQASVSGGGGLPATSTVTTPVSSAPVPGGIAYFQSQVQSPSGSPQMQAGSHPYAVTTALGFNVSSLVPFFGGVALGENSEPRDIQIALPSGLIGNPQDVPRCPSEQWAGGDIWGCPASTQVGVITLFFYGGDTSPQTVPVYNVTPPPGRPAQFGFTVAGIGVPIFFHVRTGGDYGLTADLTDIPETDPVLSSVLTIWGTPADPAHNSLRFYGISDPNHDNSKGASSDAPQLPLLSYPTDCQGGPLTALATSDPWQSIGTFTSPVSSSLPAPTGCDRLSFQPSLTAVTDNQQAGQPTGLQVSIHVPQTNDPGSLATPELQNATVTLPQGVVINPASAGGLQGCSDAEIALSSDAAATCPSASQIGTVQVNTPLLPQPLSGRVFLGTPQCSPCTSTDAQDGKMVRLFIQAQGYGVIIKLAGNASVNPSTGQLTTTFDQNPQLPFTDLVVNLKGGPRAPIANPTSCGTYATTSDLSPWSSPFTPDAFPSSSFDVTGCGSGGSSQTGFTPTFSAGAENPQAGAYSPFTLKFSRDDSDQFFSGLTATLPEGMVAKLAGVPLCSTSDANAGTCPPGSRVGSATIASGPGSEPLWLPQPGAPQPGVFLTGPYRGAPYGLVVETPAIAGPFNLGTVVVRQALFINPTDAQVTVKSDPFPTMVDGIPLQIRTVDVTMNRPDFTINPTSCDPMAITGTLSSAGGMGADVSSRFQVGGCAALSFTPKLKMALSGKGQTRSADHPTLTAAYTMPAGDANTRSVRAALPLSLALDPDNSQHVCSYAVAQAVTTGPANCPASTLVGHATAITPLLSRPLSGPVYLVQGIRMQNGVQVHTLPSLLIPLRGQIALDLRAQSSVSGGKLVTTFPTVPDAPVSKFTLTINGGRKGILVITGRGRSICGSPQVTQADLVAQNGKAVFPNVRMGTPCRVSHHKVKRHAKRKHAKRRASGRRR